MKFAYRVNHNGVLYEAGQEVPIKLPETEKEPPKEPDIPVAREESSRRRSGRPKR